MIHSVSENQAELWKSRASRSVMAGLVFLGLAGIFPAVFPDWERVPEFLAGVGLATLLLAAGFLVPYLRAKGARN